MITDQGARLIIAQAMADTIEKCQPADTAEVLLLLGMTIAHAANSIAKIDSQETADRLLRMLADQGKKMAAQAGLSPEGGAP
ncbi:MAG: hypothetical protein LCH73_02805 [Proteobacteria bacterium]|nr:hypothetical protein [Pseudomonadota bacterium]